MARISGVIDGEPKLCVSGTSWTRIEKNTAEKFRSMFGAR